MKNRKIKPPRLAEFLLKYLAPDNFRNVSPGDFEEVYNHMCHNKGRIRAGVWYRLQILRSVIPFFKESFYRSISMFRNYFVVAIRNLKRNKVYSLLNVMGLAIGITAFIFIALDIQYELSYDRYHDNAESIYRVAMERPGQVYQGSNRYAGTPGAMAQSMLDDFPEVESSARIFIWSRGEQILQQGEKAIKENLHYADPQIFEIFTMPFIKGNPESALSEPWSLVISQSLAEKYFGNEDPVGKVYSFKGRYTLTITGVFETMPMNSHFTMDMITSMETFFQLEGWGNEWDGSYCKTYILLSENADPEELETKFPAFMDNYRYRDSDVEDSMKEKLYLQPLTSIHLNSHINAEFKANYDMKNVYLFSSVGLLIIIIACMNYMNLATTRAIKRSKEVGMRKVAGAKRGQLIKQFIGESVVLTMIALFVSMILVYMILPWFSTYLGKDLNLNPLENISLIFLPVVLLIVVGIIAGSYPALYISSFRPVAILKGNITKSSRKAGLRNILVAGQFTITILMIISTLVVKDQLNFIRKKDMGFSREQILVINTAGNSSFVRNAQTLISELQRNPNIGEVSAPVYLPNNMLVQNDQILPAKEEGKFVTVIGNWVDYSFTDLFELEIVEGRNFSREFSSDAQGAVLINETAAEACKWDSPLGKVFNTKNWGRNDVTIVGIVKDFHLRSLHEPIRPAMILLSPNSFASLAMKINTENIPETINYVKNTLDRYSPGYPFEYHFFDEIFEESYKAEKKTEAIFNVFAYLSIIIACIGLIGLSSFTAEQKTREIGIRKTFGATVPGIVSLLSKEFTKWVLISNIIAWPLANFFMSRWLEQFAYRIDMSIITYFTAGGAALLIAFITVSFQSVKAAMTNPTVSLRHQ